MSKKANDLFNFGRRDVNIKHAQLRLQCSKLNFHLFNLHVIDSPSCDCGNAIEDCKHHFLHCPLYINQRRKMLQSIQVCSVFDISNLNDILMEHVIN